MKTSLEIDDALYRRARIRAAETGTTLRALVESGLQAILATQPPNAETERERRLALIRSVQASFAANATDDRRTNDEIIGYDESGGFG